MMRLKLLVLMLLVYFVYFSHSDSFAQSDESKLKVFGYFQTSFQHEKATSPSLERQESLTFNLQQLNMFFQRDITQQWTSFVNVEIVNNYSSSRQWGSFNLEEAWVKYRWNNFLSLKLGLQIPKFNNLNEIKNRTPLLPYIIRPLVYETSMSEAIASLKMEEYFPARSFVKVYGFIPYRDFKLDYAVYLGNSPNISVLSPTGQSGIDTSSTKLVGGRFGIRLNELKVGVSLTYDYVNFLQGMEVYMGGSPTRFEHVSRVRFGSDLS